MAYLTLNIGCKISPLIFSNNTMPYVLPRYRVQDIDTMEDWKRAELMFKILQDELV